MIRSARALCVLLPTWLACAVSQAATPVPPSVPVALPSIGLVTGNGLTAPEQVYSNQFGIHQASAGSAVVEARVGAQAQNVPFISFSGAASGKSFFDMTGSLEYYWVLNGDASNGPVPVSFTTLGSFAGQMTAQSLLPDRRVGVSANWLSMSVGTTFQTYVGSQGRMEEHSFGLNSGRFNRGVNWERVTFSDPELSSLGGQVTAQGSASFSKTFELMVMPNVVNRITMQVGAIGAAPSVSETVAYNWSASGYIDPIITVDSAYASSFNIVQSPMPLVPVPEASAWAMMATALTLLAFLKRRTRTGATVIR